MRIREATPSDAEAVRSVHAESIRGLGTQAYSGDQVDAWARGCENADYTAAIESTETNFLVATTRADSGRTEEGVVGFASLSLESPTDYDATVDAEVTGVYVHPEMSRQGVGTSLYRELERRARAADVETLGLKASRNAVPFYDEHGFERVREHDHEFSGHESTGVTGVVVEMRKDL